MMLMLGAMLFVPDPTNNVRTIAIMFLVYNIFTSLQDVSTDALAVDVLQPHEVEKVNRTCSPPKRSVAPSAEQALGPSSSSPA